MARSFGGRIARCEGFNNRSSELLTQAGPTLNMVIVAREVQFVAEEMEMTDETETKEATAQPSVAELEAKVQRLATQVENDLKLAQQATDAFSKAVKSGDVDKALELADVRQEAQFVVGKSEAQLKTAKSAIESAKYAANAEKIAAIHDAIRGDAGVNGHFDALHLLGVTRLVLEVSEETGKMLINSSGPAIKKARGGGNSTGSRGQSMTVDGQEYASASAANLAFFPDSGPLNRESIVSKLVNAGHEVS